MQGGDQLRGMPLDASGDAAAIGLDEIHDEEIWLREVDGRNRKIRMAGELAEHVRLEAEIGALASLPRLDGKRSARRRDRP